MKSKLVFSVLVLLSTQSHAGQYEDCVLTGMKGVSSDAAARVVTQACRNKDIEADRKKQEKLGFPMKDDEYAFNENNGADTHQDGFYSHTFRNKSNYKTVTYVALEILDADYYEYKTSIFKEMGLGFLADDFVDEAAWKRERSQTYYFKLSLKPNAVTKLLYRTPRTKTWRSKVATVLGRESKWSDSISTSAWGDTVKPEPKDPLE